jgi:hypothetical protein
MMSKTNMAPTLVEQMYVFGGWGVEISQRILQKKLNKGEVYGVIGTKVTRQLRW